MPYYNNYLAHYGVKGMKWGVRRYRNEDGSLTGAGMRRYAQTHSRTLKKGTEIQNISSRQLDRSNKRGNRLYASYTAYDKNAYADFMAGFQYDNKGWKNSFVVKKGFDAVLDTNDAYGGMKAQDPLIIFNMDKLGKQRSIKLSKEDIEAAAQKVSTKEHRKSHKDYSSVAR